DLSKSPHHISSPLSRCAGHVAGWYWGSVTASEAKRLLLEAVDGTFLLRDSSNPAYLLTLSVRTALGTTHLRIEYAGGNFGFDSAAVARPRLRQFKGAVDLVQHYALHLVSTQPNHCSESFTFT
uniref:SH2 domain-containing protein n=1 Tax=Electrophorus electricus TaxID=8005 RepID=A0A4W4FTH8_ELEEL